jgi:aerobic carbon-monoxide dehydrogenase medium subunit
VPSGASAVYLKHRHPASAFAVVGVAALVTMKGDSCAEVRIAIGGATAVAVRATAAEQLLHGKPATAENIERAAQAAAQALKEPIGDSYASGEFRTHLAAVMTKRALIQLAGKGR